MPLLVTPKTLPTMEPIVASVITNLQLYMQDALNEVASRHTDGIELQSIKAYRTAYIRDYGQIQEWPTITVTARGPSCIEADEQGGYQLWRGSVDIDAFVMTNEIDQLSLLLYRYEAAVWLALIQADSYNGALLDYGSMTADTSVDTNSTATARAIGLSVDALFRT